MPGPPSAEARAEARRVYETTGSIHAASRATGIARQTIRGWIKAEGWIYLPSYPLVKEALELHSHAGRRTQAEVIDLFKRDVMEQAHASGVVVEAVDDVADLTKTLMREQGRLALTAARCSQQAYDDWQAGTLSPAQAIMLRAVAAAAAQALTMAREYAGRKPGDPSVSETAATEHGVVIEQRRLETKVIDVDARGRAVQPETEVREGGPGFGWGEQTG